MSEAVKLTVTYDKVEDCSAVTYYIFELGVHGWARTRAEAEALIEKYKRRQDLGVRLSMMRARL